MDSEQLIDSPIGKSPKKHEALRKSLAVFMTIAAVVGIGYLLILKNDSDKKITSLDSQIADIKKQLNSTKSELAIAKSNLEAVKSSDDKTTNTNVNDSTEYYSIKSWGVKFIVPSGLNVDDITIDIRSDQDAYDTKVDQAGLSVKQIKGFGDACSTWSLGTITRAKQDLTADDGPDPAALLSSSKIGDYYYYYSAAQALCNGGNGSDPDSVTELKYHGLLNTMVKTIRSI